VVGSNDNEFVTGRGPLNIPEFPRFAGDLLRFACGGVGDPEPRVFVIEINTFGVVFIFYFFFLEVGFWLRSEKRDLFAIGRPSEILNGSFAFRETTSFTAINWNDKDLLFLVTV